jgi:hypothetical protein
LEDAHAGTSTLCLRCGTKVPVPATPVAAAAESPSPLPAEAAPDATLPSQSASPEEERKAAKAARRRAWGWVHRGLGFHYAAVAVLILGVAVLWASAFCWGVGVLVPTRNATVVASLVGLSGFGAVLLAVLIDLPCLVLCGLAPDGKARLLVGLSLLPRLGLALDWLWLLLAQRPASLPFWAKAMPWVVLLVCLGASAALWLAFLRRLAVLVKREEIADHALDLVGMFVRTLVAQVSLPLVFLTVVLLLKFAVCFGVLLAASFVTALVRIVLVMESFDDIGQALLYPTGIPFLVSYLHHLGSLRHVLLRKSGGHRVEEPAEPAEEEFPEPDGEALAGAETADLPPPLPRKGDAFRERELAEETERFGSRAQRRSRKASTSALAPASLILGLVSFCVPGLLSVPAVVLSLVSLWRIQRSQGRLLGLGMAVGGMASGLASLLLGIGLAVLLVPVILDVREAAESGIHQKKLQRLALAMHNYHDTLGTLPPAVVYDGDGRPLYGWRVLLLPFVEQGHVYNALKLDEPWDSPHNAPLLARMPDAFAGPGQEGRGVTTTYYQVFTGKGSAFEGGWLAGGGQPELLPFRGPGPQGKLYVKYPPARLMTFTDGTANTILIVKGVDAVPWAAPTDLAVQVEGHSPVLERFARDGFTAAMADGSARRFPRNLDLATLRSFITPNGGEIVPTIFDGQPRPRRR